MKKTLLFILLFTIVSFYVSAQKTKPTTVKYHEESNTTAVSFKKEKDFILPGKWEKYTETEDKWKFYLRDSSYQIGVSKIEQKKSPFYKKGMSTEEYLNKYIAVVDGYFPSEKYEFIVLEGKENIDFKFYKVIEIESNSLQNSFQDTKPRFLFKTINLVGLKKGIVYDLSVLMIEGEVSKIKEFLSQLFKSN